MKPLSRFCLYVLTLCTGTVALAHGPARVKLQDQIEIAAPPEKVWAIIADFCSIKDWNPLVEDCQNDKGNEKDAVRVITLDNGARVEQKLARWQPEHLRLQYYMIKANPDAYPVNTHGVMLSVLSADNGGSILELKGNFYRIFPGQSPPPGQTDADGKAALMRIHRAGMENVKRLAEN